MDKQAQDKRWNELSDESKKFIRDMYDEIIKEAVKPENQKLDDEEADGDIRELWGRQSQLIELFGYHNLNPEPPTPKTWEDVEDNYVEYQKYVAVSNDIEEGIINIEDKLRLKLLATYRIAKLIELGYGGMVSEEEWNDEEILKFGVKWSYKANNWVYHNYQTTKSFITFHTSQQRQEFMSYESNRKLVEQYYMM